MRGRLHSKLITALLAPALLASSGAPGLLFARCESMVRMPCCCAGETPTAPVITLTLVARQCCDEVSVPSIPARNLEPMVPIVSEPILVAVLGRHTSVRPAVEQALQARPPGPPAGPSPVLANYALLI